MIAEDYISFETAKLLKEKGFDVPVERFYNNDGLWCRGASQYNWNDDKDINDGTEDYSMPSIYIAMKWLREVHHVIISIIYANIGGLGYKYAAGIIKTKENGEIEEGPGLDACVYGASYEEACEASIKYCLENLI